MRRVHGVLILVLSFSILGCQPIRKVFFEWAGVTLDRSVVTTSLKELHLGGLVDANTNVIISGKVTEAGAAGTYVVIEEWGSKILVDVTNSDQIVAATFFGKTLQVYGRLEGGKKGLPLVVATGVRELR